MKISNPKIVKTKHPSLLLTVPGTNRPCGKVTSTQCTSCTTTSSKSTTWVTNYLTIIAHWQSQVNETTLWGCYVHCALWRSMGSRTGFLRSLATLSGLKEWTTYFLVKQHWTDRTWPPEYSGCTLRKITDEIFKMKIFGRSVAHIQVIEFQKRGYPHAHIIIHLANEDKLQDDVDQLISAEIPDSTLNPTLHSIVISQMMHGPCGDLNPNCPCEGYYKTKWLPT